jgi:hypothetical protein
VVRRGWRLVSTWIVYHGVKICQGEFGEKTKRRAAHPFINQPRKGRGPEARHTFKELLPPTRPLEQQLSSADSVYENRNL